MYKKLLLLYKEERKNSMMSKQHIRKELNLNSYACKRYKNKMFIKTRSELASKVLYEKFKKNNIVYSNYNYLTIGS